MKEFQKSKRKMLKSKIKNNKIVTKPFKKVVKAAKESMMKNKNARKVILSSLVVDRRAIIENGGKKINKKRVLPIPQRSGIGKSHLIPIFQD